jgi:hypothetical protein
MPSLTDFKDYALGLTSCSNLIALPELGKSAGPAKEERFGDV